jgi:sulfur carrier protein
MKVFINGDEKSINKAEILSSVIYNYLQSKEPRGIAVAVNENIIRKDDWEKTVLHELDRIEIVTAMQGG